MDPRFTSSERDRDALDALADKLEGRSVVVERYTAVGSTSARIPIACERLPVGVALINARLFFDQGAPLPLTPNFNFVWDSESKLARVYEPDGLTANTDYRLTFLVIGG